MPPTADLDDAEKATLAALLRQVIAADPFPLSLRIRTLRTILDKLEPPPARPQPFPGPRCIASQASCCARSGGGPQIMGYSTAAEMTVWSAMQDANLRLLDQAIVTSR